MMKLSVLFLGMLRLSCGFMIEVCPPRSKVIDYPRSYAIDVGCGEGASTRMLQRKFPDSVAVGIDINRKIIEKAVQGTGFFVHGDAGKENFPNDFFDVAQIKYSMLDIVNKVEVVDQLYRVMKKDSILFLADYDEDHPILDAHPLRRFYDPYENLKLMNYYFTQQGIIYKNQMIYSVFYKPPE